MEFIQLDHEPQDGIAYNDRLCFGIRVPLPEHIREAGEGADYLFKFREHSNSPQNGGDGWYCNDTPIQFKLILAF